MNFLFDKSFESYIHSREIHDFFGTKSSTIGAKSRVIRDLLNLDTCFDKDFSTSSMRDQNPFDNFVEVDGFLLPLESLPEECQQMVKEARSRGEDIAFKTDK